MVTEIVGPGTAEAEWLAWPDLESWPALDLSDQLDAYPPLVVAPHPNDEILGAGGLLTLLGNGELVAVTDGSAHPATAGSPPAELIARRRAETSCALRRLGLPGIRIHALRQQDGAIDETALTAYLSSLLFPGRWCVSTWRGDGDPDHEAAGRAAQAACAATGGRLIEYPIWTWHWARPGTDEPPGPHTPPWHRAHLLHLPPPVRGAKAAAIRALESQPLDEQVLARFHRPMEVFFA